MAEGADSSIKDTAAPAAFSAWAMERDSLVG
jgi:hypothetical protein